MTTHQAAGKASAIFDVGINEWLPAPQLVLLGLQNIFGIIGVAGDAIGRAKHQGVVFAEYLFQFRVGQMGRVHGGSHYRFHRIRTI